VCIGFTENASYISARILIGTRSSIFPRDVGKKVGESGDNLDSAAQRRVFVPLTDLSHGVHPGFGAWPRKVV
jgi:hypothetical protein